jgi:Cof subfamily protein (haloacid dehalogenase superfamily)
VPDIQLLVLDIDGTLAGESNQVEPPVLDAIQKVQAKGIPVAIATGRMYCAAERFHKAVGSTLPLISYQGAMIKDPQQQRLLRHLPLARHHAFELLDLITAMDGHELLSLHLYINDQLHVRALLDDTREYAKRSGVEPVVVGDLQTLLHQQPELEITKFLALSPDPAVVGELLAQLRQRYTPEQLYLTTSVANFFEAANPAVNKGNAVQYLAEELLGLSAKQVMTVGDNFNDWEMIDYAGVGVAMGDAPEPVKTLADWVAPSAEDHGVAAAIEHFLL